MRIKDFEPGHRFEVGYCRASQRPKPFCPLSQRTAKQRMRLYRYLKLVLLTLVQNYFLSLNNQSYSVRHLIGSQIIESAAYCFDGPHIH